MKTLTCPECGVTFTTSARNQVCCSDACRKIRIRRLHAVNYHYKHRELTDCFSASAPVSFDKLSRATTKPANTSAVRWRIELRRRAMLRRYGQKNLDMLPHPDTPCISASLRLCV